MKLYISRQHYYYSGEYTVEVSIGGSDYSGADALGVRFPHLGEGKTYRNPIECVEDAISVRDQWQKEVDANNSEPFRVQIGMGYSHGMSMEVEDTSDEELRDRAKKLFDRMDKCRECGELLDEKRRYANDFSLMEREYCFCSEGCAEKDQNSNLLNDCNEGFHHVPRELVREAILKGESTVECPTCNREVDLEGQ